MPKEYERAIREQKHQRRVETPVMVAA